MTSTQNTPPNNPREPSLEALRGSIDAIDSILCDILVERSGKLQSFFVLSRFEWINFIEEHLKEMHLGFAFPELKREALSCFQKIYEGDGALREKLNGLPKEAITSGGEGFDVEELRLYLRSTEKALLAMLGNRMLVSRRIGLHKILRGKTSLFVDPARKKVVLENCVARNPSIMGFYLPFWEAVHDLSVEIQRETLARSRKKT